MCPIKFFLARTFTTEHYIATSAPPSQVHSIVHSLRAERLLSNVLPDLCDLGVAKRNVLADLRDLGVAHSEFIVYTTTEPPHHRVGGSFWRLLRQYATRVHLITSPSSLSGLHVPLFSTADLFRSGSGACLRLFELSPLCFPRPPTGTDALFFLQQELM